jgi:hypothetical protein
MDQRSDRAVPQALDAPAVAKLPIAARDHSLWFNLEVSACTATRAQEARLRRCAGRFLGTMRPAADLPC